MRSFKFRNEKEILTNVKRLFIHVTNARFHYCQKSMNAFYLLAEEITFQNG
jgi:hypothetical protein